MNKNDKILILGSTGLVGSSIVRKLKELKYNNLICPRSYEFDLTKQSDTYELFHMYQPEYVFLCAAMVGGIMANKKCPANFIHNNLCIQINVMNDAWHCGSVQKLLFLGSSCIYPRNCQQPIKEEYLLSGYLEESNKSYAVAKIAGLIACEAYNKQFDQNFISVMPTNLYGPNDNFNNMTGHVLPALIDKFHNALPDKPITLWGTGTPKREFLYVNDLADACVLLMKEYNSSSPINVGYGKDISIKELALMIQDVVQHKGEIIWDTSFPDGTPRKLLDISKIKKLGWEPKIDLRDGIIKTYKWYLNHL